MKYRKKNTDFIKVKIYDVYNRNISLPDDVDEPFLYINPEHILYILEYGVYAKIVTSEGEFSIYKQYLNIIKQIKNVEEQIY